MRKPEKVKKWLMPTHPPVSCVTPKWYSMTRMMKSPR